MRPQPKEVLHDFEVGFGQTVKLVYCKGDEVRLWICDRQLCSFYGGIRGWTRLEPRSRWQILYYQFHIFPNERREIEATAAEEERTAALWYRIYRARLPDADEPQARAEADAFIKVRRDLMQANKHNSEGRNDVH